MVAGNGFFARAVRHIASDAAALVGDELGVTNDGVPPNLIIVMPRALAQLSHADTGRYVEVRGSGAIYSQRTLLSRRARMSNCGPKAMDRLLWGRQLTLFLRRSVS